MRSVRPKLAVNSVEEDGARGEANGAGGDEDEDDEEGARYEDVGEDGDRIEAESEEVNVRKLNDQKLPSEREVEEHYLRGHCPFRSWCSCCVPNARITRRKTRRKERNRKWCTHQRITS